MTKHKVLKPILILLLLIAVAAGIFFGFFFVNMNGAHYKDIARYKKANPHKVVYYSTVITGGAEDVTVTGFHKRFAMTSNDQTESMVQNRTFLWHVDEITFEGFTPTGETMAALQIAFPETPLRCTEVELLDKTYPYDTTTLDLSDLPAERIAEAAAGLKGFPELESVVLSKNKQVSHLTPEQAATLQEAVPAVHFEYTTELFGQLISTDMESVEYFQVPIKDEGLAQFRTLAPLMYNLTYLKLDWCETTNEATAALRSELKPMGIKVVWRVFFDQHNILTDSYKLWATWSLDTREIDNIKYCNELKYLDLGHNSFMNLDFMLEMTELEMAILAIGNLHDISGIVNCTKLEFLEIFSNRTLDDEDMQHLGALTNMKYLNVSNTILMRDLSFTDSMPKLRKFWNTISRVPQAEVERVKALHPDCTFVFTGDSDPTDHGWRYEYKDGRKQKTPEYELVCARFGYETWDFARYPKGYSREEITYESLGLTPS